MNGQPIRGQYYLEEELLAVGVDEGLHLPGHGDQVAEEAGGALDRMLLRHGEAGDGRLQSSTSTAKVLVSCSDKTVEDT